MNHAGQCGENAEEAMERDVGKCLVRGGRKEFLGVPRQVLHMHPEILKKGAHAEEVRCDERVNHKDSLLYRASHAGAQMKDAN